MTMKTLAAAGLAAALILVVGCGGAGGYKVSGKATFKGQPIQNGRIYFDPDLTKKNDGQQGSAEIKNGVYDTSAGGKSPSGGPYLIRIEAFDGAGTDPDRPNGKPLFGYYQEAIDLPKQALVKDFDVPASALKAKPPAAGGHVGP